MSDDILGDLTAYIDGELPPERAKQVEAALAADPKLKALEARLRATVQAVEALPAPQPSAALRRAVFSKLDEPTWRERVLKWLTPPRLVPVGLAVAAAVTAVVLWPPGATVTEPGFDEDALLVAQNLELADDLDVVGLDSPDDVAVVAQLDELEVMR
ncbi:MAG: zf-HC2 domain-containing protein [Myxococcota bacterium]